MKKMTALVVGILMITMLSPKAIELSSSRFELNIESLKSSGTDYLESHDFLAQDEGFDIEPGGDKSIYEYQYKSPKKAFIYSLIIPGWGQKYAKSSIIKSILFLAVEAGSWAGYFKYHSDGNKKTDEFMAFADGHWFEGDLSDADTGVDPPIYPNLDEQTYRGWLLTNYGTVADTGFTERLPSSKTQQYYEMIGKYDQFRGGWDDYWVDTTDYVSARRASYLSMREKANNLLDDANRLIIVSMLNHLISAFDAAISANRYNKHMADDTWSVKAELKNYTATEKIPVLTITHKF